MSIQHWEAAYAAGDAGKSWYQAEAAVSLRLVGEGGGAADAVLDVGGGASTLVDGLLAAGYRDLTVLDIADAGMAIARERLGSSAGAVTWIAADLLRWRPERTYDVWHDRAVLHFLVTEADRQRYRDQLLMATAVGSRAVIGCFGLQGPESCSGLSVQRADADGLMAVLGDRFALREAFTADHRTPAGGVQQFQWLRAERVR